MDVAELEDRLADRAFLHDDPQAYLAGVRDALAVVVEDLVVSWEPDDERDRRGA